MKSLRVLMLIIFLLLAATFVLAQRNDIHPSPAPASSSAPASSPSPASSPVPAANASSAPGSSSSSGGSSSSHSASAPSNSSSGNSIGSSSSRSSGGSSGGGRADTGGGNMRSDRSNANSANSSRSDHSNRGNNRMDRNIPGADRSIGGSSDRRGQPSSSKPITSDVTPSAGGDVRSGKQRHENSPTPNANRENKGDIAGHAKPGPTVKPTADPEKASKSHFHWFWKRSPRSAEETGTAKAVHPALRKPSPCKGNNCKPACSAGQTPGEAGGCVPSVPTHLNCSGTIDTNGNCIPSDPCVNGNVVPGVNCRQNPTQYATWPDCSSISAEIGGLQNQIEVLMREEQLVCRQDPNTPDCIRIREELRRLQERLSELQRQHFSCLNTQRIP